MHQGRNCFLSFLCSGHCDQFGHSNGEFRGKNAICNHTNILLIFINTYRFRLEPFQFLHYTSMWILIFPFSSPLGHVSVTFV